MTFALDRLLNNRNNEHLRLQAKIISTSCFLSLFYKSRAFSYSLEWPVIKTETSPMYKTTQNIMFLDQTSRDQPISALR